MIRLNEGQEYAVQRLVVERKPGDDDESDGEDRNAKHPRKLALVGLKWFKMAVDDSESHGKHLKAFKILHLISLDTMNFRETS